METVKIAVTLGTARIIFILELLGIAEESKLRQSYFGLDDEKTFETSVNTLAKYSREMPKGLFPNRAETAEEGDRTVCIEDFQTPEEAIREYFSEKTASRERIAEYTVRAYLQSLQPQTDF